MLDNYVGRKIPGNYRLSSYRFRKNNDENIELVDI
jgi:hypothetical protein